MKTIDYAILEYLKENAVSRSNAIKGKVLAYTFGISTMQVRKSIARIRKHQDIIVGSDIKYGYYIPLKKEVKKALLYAENKTLSELENRIKQNPAFALKAYKTINETLKKANKAHEGQIYFNEELKEEYTIIYGDSYVE